MNRFGKASIAALAAITALTATTVGASGTSVAAASAPSATSEGGYTPLQPARVLDTRHGNGRPGTAPVGPDGVVSLQVTSRGGVPTSGVTAVVLNLTSTGATSPSYFTAWPAGKTRPTTSSLNFRRGETRANLVTVPIGTGGKVNLVNKNGAAHMIADVVGYYRAAGTTTGFGSYYTGEPWRLLDSREVPNGYTHSGDWWTFGMDFGPDFDSTPIKAVAVNITAITPTGNGYLRAWSGAGTPPNASSLNYTTGTVTPNMAIVPTTLCAGCGYDPNTGVEYDVPIFDIANFGASLHIAVDVIGFYDENSWEGQGSLRFRALDNPDRIVDTRSGKGASTLGPGHTRSVLAPVAGADTGALAANLTAVAPTMNTFVTAWPSGTARPEVSNINAAAGSVVANMAQLAIGADNRFQLYNHVGRTDVLVDVSGTFEAYPASSTSVAPRVAKRRPSLSDATPYVRKGR